MKRKISRTKKFDDLRKRAEKKMPGSTDSTLEMSPSEIQKLVHELHVQQIELEMQNEALRKSQMEATESQQKYSDLYDFAPVGYFTLDKKGRIIEANVTGATLLGAEKRSLAKQPFQRFIAPEHLSIFQSHLQKAIDTQGKQACKLKLVKRDGSLFDALMDTIAVTDGKGRLDHYRAAITDVTKLKELEEALRKSVEKFVEPFQSNPACVGLSRLRDGLIIEANEAMLDLLGYNKDEFIGHTIPELGIWNDLKDRERLVQTLTTEGRSLNREFWLRTRTGELLLCSHSAEIIQIDNESHIIFTFFDLTERKRVEEALRENGERYRALAFTADSMYLIDRECRYQFVNAAHLLRLGRSSEEVTGRAYGDFHSEEDTKQFAATIEAVFETGKSLQAEHKGRIGDSFFLRTFSPVRSLQGDITAVTVISKDITQRKKAEEALRIEMGFINKLIQASPAFFVAISAEGRIILMNDSFLNALGYSHEQVVGKDYLSTVVPERERDLLSTVFEKIVMSHEPSLNENHVVTTDGRELLVEWHGRPVFDDEGNMLYFFGVGIDITERNQAEESLKESEEKYRALVETTDTGFVIIDGNGTVLDANENYIRMTGRKTLDEIRNRSVVEWTSRRDLERNAQAVKKCFEQGFIRNLEISYVNEKGEETPVEINATVIETKGGKRIVSLCRSITERKRLEGLLKKEQQELKLIIDSLPIIVFYKDKEGKFIRVNKAFAEVLKLPEGEFFGKTVFDLYSTKIAEGMTNDDQEVIKSGHPKLNIIEQYETASGIRWAQTDKIPICDKNGIPFGLIGFAQDITERKQSEEALRESEEKYRNILSSIEDGYHEVDLKGNFTFVSPSMVKILGYEESELIGVNYRKYMDELDAKNVFKAYNEVYRTGIPSKHTGWEFIRKDGRKIAVEGSVSPVKSNGQVIGFRGIIRDVTDKKKIEKALRKSEEYFRAITENASDIILVVDKKGTITYASPSVDHILGLKPEELIGKSSLDLIVPEDFQRAVHDFGKAILTEGALVPNAFRVRHKDGSERILEGVGRNLFANPSVKGFVMNVRDVTDSKRAEAELHAANIYNRSLIEASLDPLVTIGPDGRITDVNAGTEGVTGYSRAELIGKDFSDYFTEPEKARAGYREVFRAGSLRDYPLEIRHRDGYITSVLYNASVYRNDAGDVVGIFAAARDITERKQAEKLIDDALQFNRTILSASPVAVFTYNSSGQCVSANEAASQITGGTIEELLAQNFHQLDSWKRAGMIEPAENALKTGRVQVLETHIVTTFGKDSWFDCAFTPFHYEGELHLLVLVSDVTWRKRAEEELVWKTAFLEAQVEASIDGILVVDDKGKVIQVNTNFINLMKVPQHIRDDTDDKPMLQHVTSLVKHPEQFLEKVIYLYEHPREISRDEIEFKDRMVLDRYSSPVIGKDGKYYGRIWTFRNITERKWAEDKLKKYSAELIEKNEEIREMSEQLWQAAKLATMGELSASVAHELNNPLATISMRAESLLTKTQQDGPMWRELKIIEQEVERMGIITANLLQFSRRRQKEISTVDICEEIEKAMELIYYHLRKRNIVIRREFAKEYPHIHADRQELRQLFLNLFTNASDAMPQGGTLTIRVSAPSDSAQIIVEVADTGTGIPPDILPKVTEPFYTTKPEGKGTGLGLAICRRIVQEHNGTFNLTSEGIPGRGATARISLPINDGTNSARLRNQ